MYQLKLPIGQFYFNCWARCLLISLRTDVLVPFGSSRITQFILRWYVTELAIGSFPVLSFSRQKLSSQLYTWPLSEGHDRRA